MNSIFASKKSLLIVAALILGAGGLFAARHKIFGKAEAPVVKKEPRALPGVTPPSRVPPTSSMLDPNWSWDNDSAAKPPERTPVVSHASIPGETLASLRENLAGMGRFKDRKRNKEERKNLDKNERKELSKKIKGLRRETTKLLRESDVARRELMDAIRNEEDPYVKKELARLLRVTDAETQSQYYNELAADSSVDNQKVAVEMLGSLRNSDSLKSMIGMAENTSLDMGVRGDSVMNIGRSIPFAAGDDKYQAEARRALLDMTGPGNEPEIREKAYRSIAFQTSFTPEEESLIAKAIETETDPQVRRIAEFTQKVMEARQRSSQR